MPISSALSKRTAVPILLTLCLAAVGGAIFEYLRSPLPWMIGAMVVTTVAALFGAPIQHSKKLRGYMVAVLGTMLGTAFTPETVTDALQWGPTLGCVLIYVVIVGGVSYQILTRVAKYDPVSSYYAAAPGGLIEMVMLGKSYGGDERVISLVHSMRLLLTVMIIPFWFRYFGGYDPSTAAAVTHGTSITPFDLGVLFVCTVVGYAGGKMLRLPAYAILGPLAVSGFVHVAGFSDARVPQDLINVAQVVLGASIGCQFAGLALKRVFGNLLAGGVTTIVMIAAAIAFAMIMSKVTGVDFKVLVLAFSPGGLAEMSLISLALGIDIAFVSTHHLFRVFSLLVFAPIIFRLVQSFVERRKGDGRP
ncbi:MAG: AbrB family transcriptional regulator [Rhodospirillaceae bacterium]|nr:AbrB family transcriptional regulator [Rhodospirillaceae bacterium]MBT6221894.1 AbrB family transcriptional regulator [Rhodospirillaceae bacterium]MBT6360700.1 AbrB family transcriptional regulator [Rhodospirillaceae bacterium]